MLGINGIFLENISLYSNLVFAENNSLLLDSTSQNHQFSVLGPGERITVESLQLVDLNGLLIKTFTAERSFLDGGIGNQSSGRLFPGQKTNLTTIVLGLKRRSFFTRDLVLCN